MPPINFKQRKRRFFRKTLPFLSNVLFFGAFIAIGIYALIYWRQKRSALNECSRYTIGYTTKIANKTVYYRYSIGGRNFTDSWGQMPRSWNDYRKGDFVAQNFLYKRFLVRVSCKQPSISEITWSYSIPEWMDSAPYEGWTILPATLSKTEFAD
ncbi:hypothetical protein GO755_19705 [Spirosoma sp. HMF4905]|uniref:Uncharacterized protein n=1 Tax=Spirosoma arboris TaxID=2682092 RepID=A0A7K1SEQ2_9BACT|nr:hypothetical protein [Spirosoma arboris]MVM32282.1 hypothetical protein [Spirosoma arboris]